MMSEQFTIEETSLINIFDTSSRDRNIAEITAAMPYFEDEEMCSLAENVIARLSKISDSDFSGLAQPAD